MRRRLLILATSVLAFLSVWYLGTAAGQVKIVPGSAARGEQLLAEKGCITCHGLAGRGGNRAPDLARTLPHAAFPGMLATAMWNHAPQMWATDGGRRWNMELTSYEAADVFAYMYSTQYFAFPGDVARGKAFFANNCAACHSETAASARQGRPLSRWTAVNDPLAVAGRMWNHAFEMNAAARANGRTLPKLTSQDVSDLMVYLRTVPALSARSANFTLGEPDKGRLVFEKSCESCHSFGPAVGQKIDLLRRPAPQTLNGYVAAMWNHAPLMRAQAGTTFPQLDPDSMPDLTAFLFAQSYFYERGDTARGRRVFETKNCARCHEERRKESGAPDLSHSADLYSPVTLVSAVWRHTPAMFQTASRDRLAWPRFQGSEMADLIAYLNSRVILRIAAPGLN